MSRLFTLTVVVLACAACKHERPAPPPVPSNPLASIRWGDAPIDWTRPVPSGDRVEPGYVGAKACQSCHEDLFASYERHSMARSGMRPLATLDRRWLDRIFDAGTWVAHAGSGFSYRPLRRGAGYFIEEQVLDKAGRTVQSRLQPITHALSAASYGMAFYTRKGGHFYQAPLDYYPQVKRWDLDPAAVDGNPRFSKALRGFCISCHSDAPRRKAGTDQVFAEPMPSGIGCERCHGPGARHVESQRKEDIVNPARLPPARQLDVCAQCHLSSHHQLRAGAGDFAFRPGAVLDDVRVNFVAASPEIDRLDLLAHADRMMRSACWKQSAGKLTCTRCHDPHKSSFDQPDKWWDDKCISCHRERGCSAGAAARAVENDHCVRCHMRAGPPTSPAQVTVTDHWIQRRPPPRRPGRTAPPEQLISWSVLQGEPERGADLPALRAAALAEVSHVAEAELLAAGVLPSRPAVPALYEWLARRYLGLQQPWNAARANAALLHLLPDERTALGNYARLMLDSPQPNAAAEATHALDRLLALDPEDADALELRGIYLFRSGHADESARWFAAAAANGTQNAASHVALSVLADRAGHAAESLAELEAARAVEPGDPWLLDRLAARYAAAKDRAHADEIARARRHFAVEGRHDPGPASLWLPDSYR